MPQNPTKPSKSTNPTDNQANQPSRLPISQHQSQLSIHNQSKISRLSIGLPAQRQPNLLSINGGHRPALTPQGNKTLPLLSSIRPSIGVQPHLTSRPGVSSGISHASQDLLSQKHSQLSNTDDQHHKSSVQSHPKRANETSVSTTTASLLSQDPPSSNRHPGRLTMDSSQDQSTSSASTTSTTPTASTTSSLFSSASSTLSSPTLPPQLPSISPSIPPLSFSSSSKHATSDTSINTSTNTSTSMNDSHTSMDDSTSSMNDSYEDYDRKFIHYPPPSSAIHVGNIPPSTALHTSSSSHNHHHHQQQEPSSSSSTVPFFPQLALSTIPALPTPQDGSVGQSSSFFLQVLASRSERNLDSSSNSMTESSTSTTATSASGSSSSSSSSSAAPRSLLSKIRARRSSKHFSSMPDAATLDGTATSSSSSTNTTTTTATTTTTTTTTATTGTNSSLPFHLTLSEVAPAPQHSNIPAIALRMYKLIFALTLQHAALVFHPKSDPLPVLSHITSTFGINNVFDILSPTIAQTVFEHLSNSTNCAVHLQQLFFTAMSFGFIRSSDLTTASSTAASTSVSQQHPHLAILTSRRSIPNESQLVQLHSQQLDPYTATIPHNTAILQQNFRTFCQLVPLIPHVHTLIMQHTLKQLYISQVQCIPPISKQIQQYSSLFMNNSAMMLAQDKNGKLQTLKLLKEPPLSWVFPHNKVTPGQSSLLDDCPECIPSSSFSAYERVYLRFGWKPVYITPSANSQRYLFCRLVSSSSSSAASASSSASSFDSFTSLFPQNPSQAQFHPIHTPTQSIMTSFPRFPTFASTGYNSSHTLSLLPASHTVQTVPVISPSHPGLAQSTQTTHKTSSLASSSDPLDTYCIDSNSTSSSSSSSSSSSTGLPNIDISLDTMLAQPYLTTSGPNDAVTVLAASASTTIQGNHTTIQPLTAHLKHTALSSLPPIFSSLPVGQIYTTSNRTALSTTAQPTYSHSFIPSQLTSPPHSTNPSSLLSSPPPPSGTSSQSPIVPPILANNLQIWQTAQLQQQISLFGQHFAIRHEATVPLVSNTAPNKSSLERFCPRLDQLSNVVSLPGPVLHPHMISPNSAGPVNTTPTLSNAPPTSQTFILLNVYPWHCQVMATEHSIAELHPIPSLVSNTPSTCFAPVLQSSLVDSHAHSTTATTTSFHLSYLTPHKNARSRLDFELADQQQQHPGLVSLDNNKKKAKHHDYAATDQLVQLDQPILQNNTVDSKVQSILQKFNLQVDTPGWQPISSFEEQWGWLREASLSSSRNIATTSSKLAH